MIVLFLLTVGPISATAADTFKFTASAGINWEKLFTVVMVKDTWFGAYRYCSDNKLGILAVTGSKGSMFINLRHQLLLNQDWNSTEPLWTGIVKPVPGMTFYRSASCVPTADLDVDTSPDVQHCIAVNMTSDNAEIDWIGTRCSDKHFFVCSKGIGPVQPNNFTSYKISTIYPTIEFTITSTLNSSMDSCLERCRDGLDINQVAIMYDVTESTCLYYVSDIRSLPVHVTIMYNVSLNNIICVKNLTNIVKLVYPDDDYNVTEVDEDVPCTIEITTPLDPAVITTSTQVVGTTTTLAETTTAGGETTTSGVTTTADIVTSELDATLCTSNATVKCVCEQQTQISAMDLQLKVNQLKDELRLEKTSLSSHNRKRISAPDHRTSAQVIGLAGSLLLAGVVMSIVILDLQHLVQFIRRVKAKL